MEEGHQVTTDKQEFLKVGAVGFVFIGLCIVFITCLETCNGWGRQVDIKEISSLWAFRSNVGSYIGGVVGSLFTLSGFFLLYLTLQKQKEAFLKERFENKFFELLKLHRENVNEFEIRNGVKGRKCFIVMLNEFHYIYKLTQIGAAIESKIDKHYLFDDDEFKDEKVVDLAFKIFFFGVGYNSEKQLQHFVSANEFTFYKEFIKKKLKDIQDGYLKFKKDNNAEYYEVNCPIDGEEDDLTFETICYPFDGHSIRLGHYYRLLFQCVKFVDKQSILSDDEKKFYITTLRTQLSNQEQLLLYYDSLSEFGKAWHTKGYFKKYSFLRNIPLALVRVTPDPHEKIGRFNENGGFLFEWDKILSKKAKQ